MPRRRSPSSSPRSRAGAETAAPRLIRISELARLSGVPAPTIKHYMREGLLPAPARRTSRNMAYYDARLADRVRAIKELQQSHFLPLRLIGELLEPAPSPALRRDLDEATRARLRGIEPGIRAGIEAARSRRGRGPVGRSRAEVLAELQLSADDLDRLARLGLAEPAPGEDGEPVYAGADLDLIEVIHETRARGLGELFPMDILEPYQAWVRTLVRMEIELFRQRVLAGAELPSAPLAEVARDATALAERMLVAMRSKLVLPELARFTAEEAPPPDRRRPRRRGDRG